MKWVTRKEEWKEGKDQNKHSRRGRKEMRNGGGRQGFGCAISAKPW